MGTRMFRLVREPAATRRRTVGYLIGVVGPVVFGLALLPLRTVVRPQTVGFFFLVLVVITAAIGRFGPGIVASVVAFLSFNFLFLPPYGTFAIGAAEDVFALFVFLGLSVLVSVLVANAADRADAAEAREAELRTLQELSRDLVVRGPGEETYRSLLERLVATFGYASGGLFERADDGTLVERIRIGEGPLSATWDPSAPGAAPERLPLTVGNRTLGLIVLTGDRDPLTDAEGRVLRAVCDQLALVLERDRLLRAATAAEVLRQTDAVRRSLLAAVSHDLRSPLAAIKASVTDLLDPEVARGDGQRDDVLRTIDAETDRLDALVANLLDMSRIEAGVLRARPEVVDLAEIVLGELDHVERRWPGVTFVAEIGEDPATATADPVFLDRVLSNLLDNAARAAETAACREVEVVVGRQGADPSVRVVDHGPGIEAKAREQLFTAFYRLSERTPHLGPGLGLAISKGFVDLMGGSLWVEDTPGGGATFVCTLPKGSG
ncbi:MAG: ATP-binding protein [Planctomycetaceae bacterium]